jgi:hypothetical protein
MQENHNNNIEQQAGATLTNEGLYFEVPLFWGLKKRFTIKPIKPGTLIRIGMEVSKIKPMPETEDYHALMLDNAKNIDVFARVIAHAAINRELSRRWLFGIYKWILLNRVKDLQDLHLCMLIVFRQMSVEHFFFLTTLTKGMTILQRKTPPESTEAAKHSGEPSPSSKRPSDSATGK